MSDDNDQSTQWQPQDGETLWQAPDDAATHLKSEVDKQEAEDNVANEWKVGDTILALYEVKNIFTSGGMGLVYHVYHRNWRVDLVAKSPRPKYFTTDALREDFVQEAETWIKLGLHPNIVSCYYVRTLGGIPRVFAEYVPGGSLHDWIQNRRLYEGRQEAALERMLDVAIQFAWGLDYAHQQGLVHQDVKPGNVMMTPDGTARVSDFGLARARAAAGAAEVEAEARHTVLVPGAGLMTLAYCSPEQASHEPLSHKTDIWSWGVSVLEMFMGGATWMAGIAAPHVLKEIYLEQRAEDQSIPPMPPGLADLLRRCFQEDPADRPRDMAKVAEELATIYAQEAKQSYPRQKPKAVGLRADSLNNRALSLLDLGRPGEAEEAWQAALHTDPHHTETIYNQGLHLWHHGRITDTTLVEKMQQVCVAHPGDWFPLYLLANAHFERGDCEACLKVLDSLQGEDASRTETVQIRQIAQAQLSSSRQLLRTYEGHTGQVTSISLDEDGRCILSSCQDYKLRLWSMMTGECLNVLNLDSWAHAVSLSADGRFALYCGPNALTLWNITTGDQLVLEDQLNLRYAVWLSRDAHYGLCGSEDKTVELWDVVSGQRLHSFKGHQGRVNSVCMDAGNRYALSGSIDGTLRLWDIASGECLHIFAGHEDGVTSVYLSQDGRYALSGSDDKTLRLWDTTNGSCLRTFVGHTDWVLSVSLNADSRYALSGSRDRTSRLWDTSTGQCLCTLSGFADAVGSVCLDANGYYAVSGSWDHTLKLWRANAQRNQPTAQTMLSRIKSGEQVLSAQVAYENALDQAREALTTGDFVTALHYVRHARSQPGFERDSRAMALWVEFYTRLPRISLRGGWQTNAFEDSSQRVKSVWLSPDGHLGLSGGGNFWGTAAKTVLLWDVIQGKKIRAFTGHEDWVNSVCFNATAQRALSGSDDQTLKLWDVASGACQATFEGHEDRVNSVALSADGRWALSGSDDRTVRLWDTDSGRWTCAFASHDDTVTSVCFGAEGRYAFSGSNDRTVRMWDLVQGVCQQCFEGHKDWVSTVSATADGLTVVSGSVDGEILVWDTNSGKQLRTLAGHKGGVNSLCLTTDGRFLFSASHDKMLKAWDLASGACLCTLEGHTNVIWSVSVSADGRYALTGSGDPDKSDGTPALSLWMLDWELAEPETVYQELPTRQMFRSEKLTDDDGNR